MNDRFYRLCRGIVRLRYSGYKLTENTEAKQPVVYLCRHRNAIGPLVSLAYIPSMPRPWMLSVFCDKESCKKQLTEFTCPVSWGFNAFWSKQFPKIVAPMFISLVNKVRTIPVYRGSPKIRQTFVQTIKALEEGDNVIIYPDVDYKEEDGSIGELYEGFLMLEQLWQRKHDDHIRFVPVNISTEHKTIVMGDVISFSGDVPFAEEKKLIAEQMQKTMEAMAEEYGL